MDKFSFIAIMLFSIQRDMIDFPITEVIKSMDNARGVLSRADYLEIVFADALGEHVLKGVPFGVYDKYFGNEQYVNRVLPF